MKLKKYLPSNYGNQIFEKLLQLQQGAVTVAEYTEEFSELTARFEFADHDEHHTARYNRAYGLT